MPSSARLRHNRLGKYGDDGSEQDGGDELEAGGRLGRAEKPRTEEVGGKYERQIDERDERAEQRSQEERLNRGRQRRALVREVRQEREEEEDGKRIRHGHEDAAPDQPPASRRRSMQRVGLCGPEARPRLLERAEGKIGDVRGAHKLYR